MSKTQRRTKLATAIQTAMQKIYTQLLKEEDQKVIRDTGSAGSVENGDTLDESVRSSLLGWATKVEM